MKKQWISRVVWSIVFLIVIGGLVWWFFLRTAGQPPYQLAEVTRGDIVQEALASGNVQSPTTIRLHFKGTGRLVSLRTRVNQNVQAGQVLATEDTSVLLATRAQAQAAVDAAQATLRKLQTGSTPQSINVSRAQLTVAQQTLQNSYATVSNTLADAYAKGNDAVTGQIAPFYANAQTNNPQLSFVTSDSQVSGAIVSQRVQAGVELSAWQTDNASVSGSLDGAQLDQALSKADAHLAPIQMLLATAVTAVAANVNLSSANVVTYRANAAAGLTEVNAAITEIRALQQSIASQKAAIAQSQAELDLVTASTTSNDLDAAQAQVEQTQANVAVIDAQIRDEEIIAPVSGIISNTNGTEGEVVGPDLNVIELMPKDALEVKVNVSEDNIVNVRVGDPARIELDAFPRGTAFAGTVSEVDPAETIIGGAVYYQTSIAFAQKYDGVKSGMTANAWIETGVASSTLKVPASALSQKNTATIVQVVQNGIMTEVPVTVGLKGQDGMVQILSGLSEGQQVVMGQK